MEMMGKRRCILAHPKACSIAIRHSNENVDFRILKYFNYRIILHSALHHVLLLSQRCVTYLSFQQRTHETPRGVVFINSAYKNLLTDVMAVANHGAQFSLIAILISKGQLRARSALHQSVISSREFKSREVAQAQIYVIVHSLLELSFCTQPFPTPSG